MHFSLPADKNASISRKIAMSSSESSSIVDQGSCSDSEYATEDECCKTTSNIEYKEDPYASEEEFLGHVDSLAYTDEPLADDSWVEEYLSRQEERSRVMTELTLRLNGENSVNSW